MLSVEVMRGSLDKRIVIWRTRGDQRSISSVIGSTRICSRSAASAANRMSMARRRAGGSGVSIGSRITRPSIGIGDDQAEVGRQDIDRKIERDRKGERVAISAVVGPFGVGSPILDARFHLDDEDAPVRSERQDIGAPPRGENDLRQHRVAERSQAAHGAACHRDGDFRPGASPRERGCIAFRSLLHEPCRGIGVRARRKVKRRSRRGLIV